MTGLEFGAVVLVPFPFTDFTGTKRRPAVVVSSAAYHATRPDVILLAVTSRPGRQDDFDLPLQDWQAAGLRKPSVVKPVALTVQQDHLGPVQGALTARDTTALRQLLQRLFDAP